MRPLYVLVFCLLYTTRLFTQTDLLNGSFESYSVAANNTDTLPLNWTVTQFGGATSSQAVSGSKAAVVWNWYYYGKGILVNGKGDITSGKKTGTPINFKPTALVGQYRYVAGSTQTLNDSALAYVHLLKFNPQTKNRDTLGGGLLKLANSPVYQSFQLPIIYSTTGMPDTVVVRFISSEKGFCDNASDGNCLYLYIDDLKLINPSVGIEQQLDMKTEALFPTIAHEKINLNTHFFESSPIYIYSSQGKLLRSVSFDKAQIITIPVDDLTPGLYFVLDNKKSILCKFIKA